MLEVVVVLGIMVIVVGMMLANFPRFRENLSIEREGSKLVLALRKAQSYALGVREFSAPGITLNDDPFCTTPPVKFPGYGVFIDTSLDKEYIIFELEGFITIADKNGRLTKLTKGSAPDWKY